jgi:hypothetical protein
MSSRTPAITTVKDALLGAVLDGFRAPGVARAQAFSMNAALGADLAAAGSRRGRRPCSSASGPASSPTDVLADPRRWHVVFGDSDMDR